MNKESLTNLKQTLKRNKEFTTLDVIEQLEQQIEKMKNCGNCRLRGAECVALEYQGILCGKTRDKWELAE